MRTLGLGAGPSALTDRTTARPCASTLAQGRVSIWGIPHRDGPAPTHTATHRALDTTRDPAAWAAARERSPLPPRARRQPVLTHATRAHSALRRGWPRGPDGSFPGVTVACYPRFYGWLRGWVTSLGNAAGLGLVLGYPGRQGRVRGLGYRVRGCWVTRSGARVTDSDSTS
jgi:hypothetical protein